MKEFRLFKKGLLKTVTLKNLQIFTGISDHISASDPDKNDVYIIKNRPVVLELRKFIAGGPFLFYWA